MKRWIIVYLIILAIGLMILSSNGYIIMKKKANSVFRSILQDAHIISLYDQFKGPFIRESKNGLVFQWQYFLETNDTVKVNIKIRNYGFPMNLQRYSVSMNYEWTYLFEPRSSLIDLFADTTKYNNSKLLLHFDEQNIFSKFLIDSSRLDYILRKGYFDILFQNKGYSIILLSEPVAEYYSQKSDSFKISNYSCGLKVLPMSFENQIVCSPVSIEDSLYINYKVQRRFISK